MVLEVLSQPYLQNNLKTIHRPQKLVYLSLENSPYAQKQHRRLGTELKQKRNPTKNGGRTQRIEVKPSPPIDHSISSRTSEVKEHRSDGEKKDGAKKMERRQQRMERTRQQFRQMSAHQSPTRSFLPKDSISVDTSKTRHGIEVLRMCIQHFGWKEYAEGRPGQKCHLYWRTATLSEPEDMKSGFVNKFPGMQELVNKTNLLRLLNQMKSLYPEEYTFYPRSWSLPGDYKSFKTHCKAIMESHAKPKPTFIVKPRNGAQGEGIYLLRNPADYKSVRKQYHVVQEYLWDVFLVNQYKFDLRVYCLIKSLEPLEIYICREGMARFSTVPYENPTDKNINTAFMHLTNYSLNKRSETFVATDEEDEGSKRTLSSVFKLIESKGYDIQKLWTNIEKIMCKTIIAILPDLKVQYNSILPPNKSRPSCFQILGFDILLLRNLKPSLLEVNGSPSLSTTHEVVTSNGETELFPCKTDILIKLPLVRDTLEVVLSLKRERRKSLDGNAEGKTESSDTNSDDEVSKVVPQAPTSERPPTTSSRLRLLSLGSHNKDKERMKPGSETDSYKENSNTSQPGSVHNSPAKCTHQREKENTQFVHNFSSKSLSIFDDSDGSESDDDDDDDDDSDEDDSDGDTDDDTKTSSEKNNFMKLFDKDQTLKMIYPECYEDQYEKLRVLERFVALFLGFIRVRRGRRLCYAGFKEFIRKCLPDKNISGRIVDILYFDGARYQDNSQGYSGLTFEGFINSCTFLAKRRFVGRTKLELLLDLLNYCEDRFDEAREETTLPHIAEPRSSKADRHLGGRLSMLDHLNLSPVRRAKTINVTQSLNGSYKAS